MQLKAFKFLQRRNAKWENFPIIYAFAIQSHCPDKTWSKSSHAPVCTLPIGTRGCNCEEKQSDLLFVFGL